MILASILLQASFEAVPAIIPQQVSIFALLVKGGWVMLPLLLLSILMVFFVTDSWVTLRKMAVSDRKWFSWVVKLVRIGDYERVLASTKRSDSALAGIVRAGIEGRNLTQTQMEEEMQVEARQVIAKLESPIGYLSMISSIAPMLGFLGTIFGVITIFMHISATNELSISSISDGLYQKMICSAVGLTLGIIAYCAYWLLGRKVDKMVLYMDRCSNILLRELAAGGK